MTCRAVNGRLSAILIFSMLVASWLAMQVVHEFGHVLAAWATGGEVTRVVLQPLVHFADRRD